MFHRKAFHIALNIKISQNVIPNLNLSGRISHRRAFHSISNNKISQKSVPGGFNQHNLTEKRKKRKAFHRRVFHKKNVSYCFKNIILQKNVPNSMQVVGSPMEKRSISLLTTKSHIKEFPTRFKLQNV